MVKNLPIMQETGFDPWVKKILWRRKWQPTPVFLPRKSHGQRNLVSYSPCDRKESVCNAGDLYRRHGFNPCVGKIPWRRIMATHSSNLT